MFKSIIVFDGHLTTVLLFYLENRVFTYSLPAENGSFWLTRIETAAEDSTFTHHNKCNSDPELK